MDTSAVTYPSIPDGAPFLFENQDKPFAGDTFMERDFLALKERFDLTGVIETGTCYGSTALWFAQHFASVWTIESHEPTAKIVTDRIGPMGDDNNISLWLGDSSKNMLAMLRQAEKHHLLCFLDAHFEDHCPLLDELEAIAISEIKPVIAIHDFQVPGRPDLGYDTWNGHPFRFSWIRESLEAIYGVNRLGHFYNHEATGAKRGCIYIHPI